MGEEHGYMDILAAAARSKSGKPDSLLPMPAVGFGRGTPNKKLLRVAIWLLLGLPGALGRALEFFKVMKASGHFAVGQAEPEPLTSTHSQLWYAGLAACLWGAARDPDAGELLALVEAVWRIETAACRACYSRLGVRTPGARAYIDGKVALENSCRDKTIVGLLGGWKAQPKIGRGSYDAAIPLLSRAFADGASPARLLGTDYSALTRRYGFCVVRSSSGDYFASFARLTGALDAIHGVGVWGGELVVCEERDAASEFAAVATRRLADQVAGVEVGGEGQSS